MPRRYHTILSCVSKKLGTLVRSSELRKTRSLMGKDCFYVCFVENFHPPYKTYHWFSLTKDRRLVSIPFPSLPEPCYVALMAGNEIYYFGGHIFRPSSSMWILDTRSGKLRQGPSLLFVPTHSSPVGLVDDKIYIFGGDKMQTLMFDLTTQTWQIAPNNPSMKVHSVFISLNRKIYARNRDEVVMRYNQIDIIRHVCVVDNMLYMYKIRAGLRWYNSKENEWRIVDGLQVEGYASVDVAIADYNGKLAFLRHERNKMKIWCSIITLYPSKEAILGRVEWSSCLFSDVPSDYNFKYYLGSD